MKVKSTIKRIVYYPRQAQVDLVKKAANHLEVSVSLFVRNAASEKARKVLKEARAAE